MSIIILFTVVIVFSLLLTVFDKIRSYKKQDKSVWVDGDSVHVQEGHLDKSINTKNFMTRIS